jgi:hypothetical protein
MRLRALIGTAGLLVTAAFVTASATYSSTARAEEEFDVTVSGNSVTVTAHAPWHINQEFEWKVKHGHDRLHDVHFTLSDSSATASGLPSGTHKVHGAVCNTSGDHKSCMPFSKEITVQ